MITFMLEKWNSAGRWVLKGWQEGCSGDRADGSEKQSRMGGQMRKVSTPICLLMQEEWGEGLATWGTSWQECLAGLQRPGPQAEEKAALEHSLGSFGAGKALRGEECGEHHPQRVKREDRTWRGKRGRQGTPGVGLVLQLLLLPPAPPSSLNLPSTVLPVPSFQNTCDRITHPTNKEEIDKNSQSLRPSGIAFCLSEHWLPPQA